MNSFLHAKHIRISDYPAVALPLRETVRANAHGIAEMNRVAIEHGKKGHIPKEEGVAKVFAGCGDHPGRVP